MAYTVPQPDQGHLLVIAPLVTIVTVCIVVYTCMYNTVEPPLKETPNKGIPE